MLNFFQSRSSPSWQRMGGWVFGIALAILPDFAFSEGPEGLRGSGKKLQFPAAPAFVAVTGAGGAVTTITPTELEAEIRAHSPQLMVFNSPRNSHAVIHADWLEPLLDWYADLLFRFGLYYERNEWDCENYAQMLASLASVQSTRAGYKGLNMPVGWITVRPLRPWANVPGATDATHALNLIRTHRGFYVIEPQNGARVALADYPNRDQILSAFFL